MIQFHAVLWSTQFNLLFTKKKSQSVSNPAQVIQRPGTKALTPEHAEYYSKCTQVNEHERDIGMTTCDKSCILYRNKSLQAHYPLKTTTTITTDNSHDYNTSSAVLQF